MNVFERLPDAAAGERFETLVESGGVRIERIVSRGQASPPGFWYDQPWNEWVCLLRGRAVLLVEEGGACRRVELRPGDGLFLPAGRRHRVESTAPGEDTIWLAVHWPAEGLGGGSGGAGE